MQKNLTLIILQNKLFYMPKIHLKQNINYYLAKERNQA